MSKCQAMEIPVSGTSWKAEPEQTWSTSWWQPKSTLDISGSSWATPSGGRDLLEPVRVH